jgi:hypothetical protein
MACDKWKERLVAGLYDELPGAERELLDRHLESCSECRAEMEELAGARESLRLAEPSVPYAPRVVVLDRPGRRSLSWWNFAAGFACATLLLVVGAAAGWGLADRSDRTVIPAEEVRSADADFLQREDLDRALQAQEARFRSMMSEGRGELLSPADLDTRFASFESNLDQRRRNDLRFLLQEILAAEVRSGTAIDETQQAVRYLAVANHPGVSEW